MNYLRILELYKTKYMKRLNRSWLYPDEESECTKKAKVVNVWLYCRIHKI